MFKKETESIIRKGKELMQKKNVTSTFVEAKSNDPIKALFEAIWSGLFAPFSFVISETDNKELLELSLKGITYCVKLSNSNQLEDVKKAFISTLAKSINVTSLRDLKPRNIECIRALLEIGKEDGSNLNESWIYIFEFLSKLDTLFMKKESVKCDWEIFNTNIKKKSSLDEAEKKALEMLANRIDQSSIDVIFSRTIKIENEQIEGFIKSLCEVARSELKKVDDPRIFCLQKIVEVADINMSRVRIIFSKVWSHISQLLTEVTTGSNINFVEFAIDSLKQLSSKYLEVHRSLD